MNGLTKPIRFLAVFAMFGAPLWPQTAWTPPGSGAAHAQFGCYVTGIGTALILVCPKLTGCQWNGMDLRCANVGRFRHYCRSNPGIPPCSAAFGGGSNNGGSGGGSDGGNGNGGGDTTPEPPPPPPRDINADSATVEACAPAGSSVFSEARNLGTVNVTYGHALAVTHGNPTSVVLAYGTSQWQGNSTVDIEISQDRVQARADRETEESYWDVFATTLIHEYYHAYDMLRCNCESPEGTNGLPSDRGEYEDRTNERAAADHAVLASCLPD